jgi:SAM-dependent methyltransferase
MGWSDQTAQGADEFATEAIGRLGGGEFPPYANAKPPRRAEFERQMLELMERVLRADVSDAVAGRLLEDIKAHLDDEPTRDRLFDGVSAARPDRDRAWEEHESELFARSANVGAVHLELGTWSAWPSSRQLALAEADGLAEVIRLDFEPIYELDVVADAQVLPFADASIDRISADSVLEHLAHPHHVIRECHRVLRPGGVMRLATPWTFHLHGYPDDYLRYSPSFYERACREAGFAWTAASVEASRGLYYTLHNAAKTVIVDGDHDAAPALRLMHLLTMEWLATLVPLDNGFLNGARHWFHSVQCVAVKGGDYEPSRRRRDWGPPVVERMLDLFADPITKRPLRLEGDRLVCPASGFRYPVRDGIPHFVTPMRLGRRRVPRRFYRARERLAAAAAVAQARPRATGVRPA